MDPKTPLLFYNFAGNGSPFGWIVHMALVELDVDFEVRFLDMETGEHRSEEYMKLNPRGKVPAIVDNGVVVCESAAIVHYLQQLYGNREQDASPSLLPAQRDEFAVAHMRFAGVYAWLAPAYGKVVMPAFTRPNVTRSDVANEVDGLLAELQLWDQFLQESKGPWICGSEFTIADIAVLPFINGCVKMGLQLDEESPDLRALSAWFQKCRARPSTRSTWPQFYNQVRLPQLLAPSVDKAEST